MRENLLLIFTAVAKSFSLALPNSKMSGNGETAPRNIRSWLYGLSRTRGKTRPRTGYKLEPTLRFITENGFLGNQIQSYFRLDHERRNVCPACPRTLISLQKQLTVKNRARAVTAISYKRRPPPKKKTPSLY